MKQPSTHQTNPIHRIVIQPNCALSPSEGLLFFNVVAASSLSIAGVFVYLGFWPILPFAGVELALLGWGLWTSFRRADYREVISISEDRVIVERGVGSATECMELPRHWTRIELRRPGAGRYHSRLMLRSGAQTHEVASCLTEGERQGLCRRLAELVGPMASTPVLEGWHPAQINE